MVAAVAVRTCSLPAQPTLSLRSRVTLSIATPENERMVRAYVAALSRDTQAVDDLSQEVFTRAIARADRIRDPDSPGPFLRGIARRVVQEHFRERRKRQTELGWAVAALTDNSPSIGEAYDKHESLQRLADAVASLPLVSRRILEMRYAEGMTATEIGEIFGIKPSAVRVGLLRIREQLRRRLSN